METLRMERHFSVPPQRVWDYVTKTEHLVTWWGPEGTTLGDHKLDFTELGPWFFVLIAPSGHATRVTGNVLAHDPPNWVEFTLYVPNPKGNAIDSTVRFEVSPAEGGAKFVLIQSGLTSEQMVAASSMGWVSTLTRLEEKLNAISST
ncbi:MAG: SRPBCC domain-containing protein [Rhodobacteraceae bacterium]|nr:SRPBCC domain-containing protein [Paracoccaceae bacterium]